MSNYITTFPASTYPRMINKAGAPIDDLSTNSATNMEADRKAFVALMHHVAEKGSRRAE